MAHSPHISGAKEFLSFNKRVISLLFLVGPLHIITYRQHLCRIITYRCHIITCQQP